MKIVDVFLERFGAAADKTAIVTDQSSVTYHDLRANISAWDQKLAKNGIDPGTVVLLKGDFSRDSISALFALLKRGAIIIPLAPTSYEKSDEFAAEGHAAWTLETLSGDLTPLPHRGDHLLYDQLRESEAAGIVLFSSGSTGKSKGVVHNATNLLEKFRAPGKDFRTLAFLLFDHIAGLDTLFYSLANQSTLILPNSRAPDDVCALIERHRAEVLPTAPSFLNLMLLSGAHARHDLSSLKIVTYGSEMMADATLKRCADVLPHVRLIQKYGTSEIGALPTRSRDRASTWLKLGGAGYHWRVRDGKFEIKAATAMIGYLNAPNPFTDDGYFMTGDRVETDGDYVRFLGRDSDIINVGGQKVFPAEVEVAIKELDQIAEIAVRGVPHAILGQAVAARVRPADASTPAAELRGLIRAHLKGRLEPYKIPQKYEIVDTPLTTDRFKTDRK